MDEPLQCLGIVKDLRPVEACQGRKDKELNVDGALWAGRRKLGDEIPWLGTD